jgi:hypothetical protein
MGRFCSKLVSLSLDKQDSWSKQTLKLILESLPYESVMFLIVNAHVLPNHEGDISNPFEAMIVQLLAIVRESL